MAKCVLQIGFRQLAILIAALYGSSMVVIMSQELTLVHFFILPFKLAIYGVT